MNYYIQGDAAKADQIRAAFEKLGYDTSRHLFNAKSVLYFTLDGEIRATTCNCTPAIIKTHPDYKELELPVEPKFKVGDWVVTDYGKVSQVVSVDNAGDGYTLDDGVYFSGSWCDMYHLWTIQDAKDGDVLVYQDEIFIARIARGLSANVAIDYDCCYDGNSFILDSFYSLTVEELKRVYPATKEQRDLLFKKMKEAGYEWDADKKELKKIQPHYDIKNFKPFDKVLIRVGNKSKWTCDFFSYYHKGFHCIGTDDWSQCIPYEGNEHLLGTTDMCPEEYINW